MPDTTAPKTVFLFFGEDNFSATQKLNFWKSEFIKKYADENSIETIEGKELKPNEFITNLEALPFLSEKRMVIVKNFLKKGRDEDQKKVAEAIEKTPDFCILIFLENESPDKRTTLFQKIKKIGKIEEFPALSPPEIMRFILNQREKGLIKISTTAANYLSTYSGPDLFTINNELEKLKYFANGKEINQEMIDNLVTPSLSASIFKLTDAIAGKNVKEALRILKILIDSGEDLSRVFFMIVRHFRILIQVADMISKGERAPSIIKKLKLHPYVVQTTSNQAKNFTEEKLRQIYQQLLTIDIGVKTGKIKFYQGDNKEFCLAIEKLITQCAGAKK